MTATPHVYQLAVAAGLRADGDAAGAAAVLALTPAEVAAILAGEPLINDSVADLPVHSFSSWRGPFRGPRGGTYWLQEGEQDTEANRFYSPSNPDDGTGGGTDPHRQDLVPGIDKAARVIGGAMVGGLTGSALGGPLGLAVGTVAGAALGSDTANDVLGGIRALLNRGEEPERAAGQLADIARKAQAGDPEATRAVQADAAAQGRAAAAQLVAQPPADPAEVRAGWRQAAGRMRAADADELGGHVEALAAARTPDRVDAAAGNMVRFLGTLAGAPLRLALGALKAFGRWAAGSGKKYLIWAATVATTAAVMAAPPAAIVMGLVSPATGLLMMPLIPAAPFVIPKVGGHIVNRVGAARGRAGAPDGFAEGDDDPGPPGPPPREGLTWKRETQRWVRRGDAHGATLARRAGEVPAGLRAKVAGYVERKYAELEARYGENGAKAVMAASVLMLPVPLPGASLIPVALAEAVRATARGVKAVSRNAEGGPPDDMVRAVIGFLTELHAEAGEPAPPVDPAKVRAALEADEIDDDEPPERFAEWEQYTGPEGGRGWTNGREVRYQDEKPEEQESPSRPSATPAPKPVTYPKGFTPPQPNAPGRHANRPNPHAPDEFRPALTLDQARAVFQYTGTKTFHQVNIALRNGQEIPGRGLGDRIVGRADPRAVHAALQSAFAAAPVRGEPVTLQRGITVPDPNGFAAWAEAQRGKIITLPGYQSTSPADPAKGDVFGQRGTYSGNVYFTIRAVHALDAKPYSRFPGEEEVILNHGQRYEVGRVMRQGGAVHVELTQLPPERTARMAEVGPVPDAADPADNYASAEERAADLDGGAAEAEAIMAQGGRPPTPGEAAWLTRVAAGSAAARLPQVFAEGQTGGVVALAGPDGRRAAELLSASQAAGVKTLHEVTDRAVRRLLMLPNPQAAATLFEDDELERIRDSLTGTLAAADLLGRARVRRRAELAAERAGATFAEVPDDPYHAFDEPIPAVAPDQAVDYFRRLVPTLGTDPQRYGAMMARHAFTLAVAAEQTVLERVKKAILDNLAAGTDGTADVQDILDAAGVSPKNPAYSETVWRTNALSQLNEGAYAELATPDMQEAFPAYEYTAIIDGRERPTHGARNGRLYPASVPWVKVRGLGIEDAANCRCSFTPIHVSELSERLKRGERVETTW